MTSSSSLYPLSNKGFRGFSIAFIARGNPSLEAIRMWKEEEFP